ncbi:hypothetical protein [uncultured Aquincola sp.]|uniref:hypothetical protein n=1 Tax=uncultured Aquincola sp. TaxID=886556 RepID=UPI0032B18638
MGSFTYTSMMIRAQARHRAAVAAAVAAAPMPEQMVAPVYAPVKDSPPSLTTSRSRPSRDSMPSDTRQAWLAVQ